MSRMLAKVSSAQLIIMIKQQAINKERYMLNWSVTFFIIAIVAAVFGFTSIAGSAIDIAKVLFGVFLILALISFILGRKVTA
jgi:uncharacterized membrane protein YtjA (UPF0391 family)